jgi:hypothetical protein
MTDWISWAATAATIAAACMTASNLGARITGYGFAVFTVGSLCWLAFGLTTDQRALVWTNIVLTGLNLFGVWRWLGRQAKVEDGAATAAERSTELPGENLFPASLLSSAPVRGPRGHDLGQCAEAMIGCTSGRIRYLVMGSGGLAGAGESFRRLEWRDAKVEDGTVRVALGPREVDKLPELAKDDWPGR